MIISHDHDVLYALRKGGEQQEDGRRRRFPLVNAIPTCVTIPVDSKWSLNKTCCLRTSCRHERIKKSNRVRVWSIKQDFVYHPTVAHFLLIYILNTMQKNNSLFWHEHNLCVGKPIQSTPSTPEYSGVLSTPYSEYNLLL
jgi:hypothetical protein